MIEKTINVGCCKVELFDIVDIGQIEAHGDRYRLTVKTKQCTIEESTPEKSKLIQRRNDLIKKVSGAHNHNVEDIREKLDTAIRNWQRWNSFEHAQRHNEAPTDLELMEKKLVGVIEELQACRYAR